LGLTGDCRKLPEQFDLYSSPHIIRVGLARHVACMGEKDMHTGFLENLKGREHLEDLCIDGRIILEWILKKLDGSVWIGSIWIRVGTMAGCMNTVMNLRVH
jgi:hypothetical protein